MSDFGQCPIWVLKRSTEYLCDEAGWMLAFSTPGKALAYLQKRVGWQCQVIAPDQLLLLIADLHEINSPGIRHNPVADFGSLGHRYPLDALAASYLHRIVA